MTAGFGGWDTRRRGRWTTSGTATYIGPADFARAGMVTTIRRDHGQDFIATAFLPPTNLLRRRPLVLGKADDAGSTRAAPKSSAFRGIRQRGGSASARDSTAYAWQAVRPRRGMRGEPPSGSG